MLDRWTTEVQVIEFAEQYREAFTSLGRPLRRRDGTPQKEIRAAEKQLGLHLPIALREYYCVAGRADDFHCVHDRLLPPAEWSIEIRKLVFMVENQAVELYGTIAGLVPDDDPPAFMGENDEPVRWHKVNGRCSVFLLVMLHWESAFGGAMPRNGTAEVRSNLRKILDRDWSFIGEVNRMRAYQKPGRALCFLKWEVSWRVFAGASSEAELAAVASELSLHWDG
jgi:hypothetical protein